MEDWHMEITLTKEADRVISKIVHHYRELRQGGIAKEKARDILSAEYIQYAILPKWTISDITEACR